MPILNTIICDCPCGRKLELNEKANAIELIEVTDAYGVRRFFLTTECFKHFAASYACPYKNDGSESLKVMLPGATN